MHLSWNMGMNIGYVEKLLVTLHDYHVEFIYLFLFFFWFAKLHLFVCAAEHFGDC